VSIRIFYFFNRWQQLGHEYFSVSSSYGDVTGEGAWRRTTPGDIQGGDTLMKV